MLYLLRIKPSKKKKMWLSSLLWVTNLVVFIGYRWRGICWGDWLISPTVLSVTLSSERIIHVVTFLTFPTTFRHLLFWNPTKQIHVTTRERHSFFFYIRKRVSGNLLGLLSYFNCWIGREKKGNIYIYIHQTCKIKN